MIELLILYELKQKVLTMYGISKEIRQDFSVLTTPSYGTIKPALTRLATKGFIKIQKDISSGGRRSNYYSITQEGEKELARLLLEKPLDNPIQFLPTARVKLACSSVLDSAKQKEICKVLKQKTEEIYFDIKSLLADKNLDFYKKMVFDNLICEYRNFISLLEGFERACNN